MSVFAFLNTQASNGVNKAFTSQSNFKKLNLTDETIFITEISADSQNLSVKVSGVNDPFASLSITNQRGATIQFALIEKQNEEFNFDLSNLKKGNYNVMLITNQEIRIKRIQIK